ncbi:MAG: hypothetical protein AB1724_09815 [Thermodesulfobacteriota bacterium]
MMTTYGNAAPSQVELARAFSSTRLPGPAMSDDLVALVVHLFTPEGAAVARHLPFILPGPVRTIARRARRERRDDEPGKSPLSFLFHLRGHVRPGNHHPGRRDRRHPGG